RTAWALARAPAQDERAVLHAHSAHAAASAVLARALGGSARVVLHRRVDFPLGGGLSLRLKYRRASRVVAVSNAIAEILKRSGLDAGRISVVRDGLPVDGREAAWAGVSPARFAPPSAPERLEARQAIARELNLPLSSPWVANAAALVPHKDQQTLIAAAVIVLLRRPDALFLIAGRGPEEEALLSSISRMGLLGKVVLLGQLEDTTLLLKAADVFALSSWGEGLGSVLLEAASCELPVAATTAGGIPELVRDGRSGLLCAPRSPEALAGNILALLEDRARARCLARRAREDLPRFGLERMALEMEKVYEQA
ncbi:MAG: glycosyltransferase, partial [Elusimicrobia bacterium]|nr:glycosyltransferase [Elusimicrobiota bacterium]